MPLFDLLLVTILPPRTDCTWPNSASDQQQSCISTKFSKSQGLSQYEYNMFIWFTIWFNFIWFIKMFLLIQGFTYLKFVWSKFSWWHSQAAFFVLVAHDLNDGGPPDEKHLARWQSKDSTTESRKYGKYESTKSTAAQGNNCKWVNVRIWQDWCYGDWAQLFFPSNYSLLSSASFSWHRTVSTRQHTSTWSDWKVEESQSFRLRSSTLLNSACSPPQSSITWKRSLHHCVFWVSFKVSLNSLRVPFLSFLPHATKAWEGPNIVSMLQAVRRPLKPSQSLAYWDPWGRALSNRTVQHQNALRLPSATVCNSG